MSNQTTIALKDIRKEYLCQFVDFRKMWEKAKTDGTEGDVEFFYSKMLFYAALIDMTTRLQNSLKGRVK